MSSTLVEQYQRQERWRRWDDALALVPLKRGERVLDLGCGVGQIANRLSQLGASVVGVDVNEELLGAARAQYPNIRFEKLDLNDLSPSTFGHVEGLWASFVPAYFPDLESTLKRWWACLATGGWLAMVEMDDLFGHEPLAPTFTGELKRFYEEARSAGRYDFESGRRLADAARTVGFEILHQRVLQDDELSFSGPASPDVLETWRTRLQRMIGLRNYFGQRFEEFEKAFLETLASSSHRARTRVFLVVAKSV